MRADQAVGDFHLFNLDGSPAMAALVDSDGLHQDPRPGEPHARETRSAGDLSLDEATG